MIPTKKIDGKDILDLEAIREGAQKEKEEQSAQFKKYLSNISKDVDKERNEIDKLRMKAVESERQATLKEKEKEKEKAKLQAIQSIEEQYEKEYNVKTSHTKKLDEAYRHMAKNLPGLND